MSEDEFKKMTFSEHFDELRKRLLICGVGAVAAFVVCFFFRELIVDAITEPYNKLRGDTGHEELGKLTFISPPEGFLFYIKACFFVAIIIDAPIILFQMWRFIGAGLYKVERAKVMRVFPFSIFLLVVGMLFGYFVMFPIGLDFLLDFPSDKFGSNITVSKYFTLFSTLILVMGFVFQTPLVMVVTAKIGLSSAEFFAKKRKFFILGAFIMSAMFTPPDWVTQCLLAGPLVVLFEIGILLCRGVKKKAQREAEQKTHA